MDATIADSSQLLHAYAAQGDEAAFRAVVDHFLPLVYSTALRQVGGNTTLAEEVAQDVFLALARKSRSLCHRSTLTPWLFNATRLSAINFLRREQRRLEREQKAFDMQQIGTPRESTDWDRIRPAIDHLLSQLSSRDQETLFMRFFEGRTFAEIGERLGIGEDGARLRSNRAIDKINASLARRGIKSTATMLASVLATQQSVALPAGLAVAATTAALSSATTTAGSFALFSLFVSLMNPSHLVVGSLALLAIAGLGGAFHQTLAHRSAEAALAAMRTENATLQRQLAEIRTEGPSLHGRGAVFGATTAPRSPSSRPADGAQDSAPAAPPVASGPVPSSVDELLRQVDYVLAHPELRTAFVDQVVQQLWGNDRRLFRSLGISLEQEEAIKKEARDYANTLLDARARRVGGEDFREVFEAADEHSLEQVRRILGEEAFARLEALKASSRENHTVDHLASRLYYTDHPLTGPQADQLTRILVENRYSPNRPHTVAGQLVSAAEYSTFRSTQTSPHGPTRVALVTDSAIARAQAALPAGTIMALRELQAQQIAQIRLTVSPAGR